MEIMMKGKTAHYARAHAHVYTTTIQDVYVYYVAPNRRAHERATALAI